jgi:hypothetical protein
MGEGDGSGEDESIGSLFAEEHEHQFLEFVVEESGVLGSVFAALAVLAARTVAAAAH